MASALYNKYRPQVFEEVVGQDHVARTLQNAIASDKTSHSYLFTGPRGTGKTTMARIFSKALECSAGPTPSPDGSCEDCDLIARGEHPDVYELDAASRTGVENVREEIIGKVQYAPTRGRYKIYIIDEVHMLSTAAFNALLKTLEEPPDHVVFILCTTDPQKVPETILSRCQRFDFRRIGSEEMIARLGAICEMEGVDFDGDALDLITHRSDGGMRDALTSLDQLIAFGGGKVDIASAERLLGSMDSSDLAEIIDAIGKRDAARCFRWTAEYMETGADLVQFVQDLTSHMRDMYVMSMTDADVPLEITEAARKELQAELPMFGTDRIARALDVLNSLGIELRTSTNQRLSFEVALTRLIRAQSDLTLSALAERIEELERSLASGAALQTAQTEQPGDASKTVFPSSSPMRAVTEVGSASATPSSVSDVQASDSRQPSGDSGRDSEEDSSSSDESTASAESSIAAFSGDADRLWETVQTHLKKIGAAFAVVFMGTTLSADEGGFVIEFESGKDFAFKASQKPEAREALDEAFAKAGVSHAAYRMEMGTGAGASTRTEAAPVMAIDAERPDGTPKNPEPMDIQSEEVTVNAEASSDGSQNMPEADLRSGKIQASDAGSESESLPEIETHPSDESAVDQDKQEVETISSGENIIEPNDDNANGESDEDFADFLASAFGEGIVIEEIRD